MQEYHYENDTHREFTSLDAQGQERRRMKHALEIAGGATLVRQVFVGRNDQCPCGSGKKFKKCCIGLVDLYQRNEEDV